MFLLHSAKKPASTTASCSRSSVDYGDCCAGDKCCPNQQCAVAPRTPSPGREPRPGKVFLIGMSSSLRLLRHRHFGKQASSGDHGTCPCLRPIRTEGKHPLPGPFTFSRLSYNCGRWLGLVQLSLLAFISAKADLITALKRHPCGYERSDREHATLCAHMNLHEP